VQQIETTLQTLEKTFDVKVYANAGHGFFCDDRASYSAAAAEDAWERLKAWFSQHLQR
jgi:carboxymethylenebutenolidase